MDKHKLKMLGLILIIVLGISSIYHLKQSQKPDYMILIGRPVDNEKILYDKPVDNRSDAISLENALIYSESIQKTDIVTKLPDATIRLEDWAMSVTHAYINVWFDKEDVIFGINQGLDGVQYKKTLGDGKQIKAIVCKYQP